MRIFADKDESYGEWMTPSTEAKKISARSVRGIIFQFFRAMVVLLTTVILARILVPEDFGVVATIMPVVVLAQMLKDFGITIAIIQSPTITQDDVSVYFWLQTAIGLILGTALALSGPLLAGFFEDARMVAIAIPMGFVLGISMVGNVHNALLRRGLCFGKISVIEITSAVLGLIAAMIGACLGLGYWALIIQQATITLIGLIGYWTFCSWRPSPWKYQTSATEGLAFGATLTVGKLFDYLRRNVDQILIRKYTDVEQLGYYGRVQRIVMIPATQIMGPVMAVAVPMLSRHQNEPNYHDYFENIYRFCVAVAVPAGFFSFFFPESVVYIILGDKWLEAVPILKGLSIIAIFHPIGNCFSVNLVVFRRLKVTLILPFVSAVLSIVAFYIGIQESVAKLAEYYGWVVAAMIPLYVIAIVKTTPVSGKKLFLVTIPLFAAMACAVTMTLYLHEEYLRGKPLLYQSLGQMVSYGIIYAFIVLFVLGYWKKIKDLILFFK